MEAQNLEGYEEVIARFLATLPLEQRLAGLSQEQLILSLPDDVLRGFSDSYLVTLSVPVRETIRKRIGR